jgi:DNA invertase Pin-like site-specific DNA recombinase
MRKHASVKGNPTIGVAYLRASTSEQLEGREQERLDIQRHAMAAGITIVAEYVDQGVSGGDAFDERPALMSALHALTEHGAGALVVKDRTRLARDVLVAGAIDRRVSELGARVISADGAGNGDSPVERFVRTVVDASSELQRATIRANTKAALATKRARGERISLQPAYGYRLTSDRKHVEPCPREQAILARASELRASGLTFVAVSEQLACENHLNRAGREFGGPAVYRLLSSAKQAY